LFLRVKIKVVCQEQLKTQSIHIDKAPEFLSFSPFCEILSLCRNFIYTSQQIVVLFHAAFQVTIFCSLQQKQTSNGMASSISLKDNNKEETKAKNTVFFCHSGCVKLDCFYFE
jgi:hypothetical protein